MKIRLEPTVHRKLETWVTMAHGMECCGYGWIRKEGDDLVVYDVILLDIRTQGYTEVQPKIVGHLVAKAMARPDLNRMKLWWHRHPLGDGLPGPHNWSGLDHETCTKFPFGMAAPGSGFTASIVRTPGGWAGRVDTYGPKARTVHLPVEVMQDGIAGEFDMIADLLGWQPPKRTYAAIEDIRDGLGDWTDLDAGDSDEDEWLPKRESYADDERYLDDLADYLGCEVEEFEILDDGTVELDGEKVGRGVKSARPDARQMAFEIEENDPNDPRGIFGMWRRGVQKLRGGQ